MFEFANKTLLKWSCLISLISFDEVTCQGLLRPVVRGGDVMGGLRGPNAFHSENIALFQENYGINHISMKYGLYYGSEIQ